MATHAEWANGYARQADADYNTFMAIQGLAVPDCHRLQFLQMACEKLVKAHLCGERTDLGSLQTSHGYVAKTLPIILRQQAISVNLKGRSAREALKHSRHLSQEINYLAPSVKRAGKRPDNCEYPWEDDKGILHIPLDWSFLPSQLLVRPTGRVFLKLLRGAINRLLN